MKKYYLIALISGIISITLYRFAAEKRKCIPLPLVNIISWSLKDQNSSIFKSEKLKGKIYIANFFSTRCYLICPEIMNSFIQVCDRFDKREDKIHFISFSVDSEYDTFLVLQKYIKKMKIRINNWTFIASKKEQVYKTLINKFNIYIGGKNGIYDFDYIKTFILCDKNGSLRGFFSLESNILSALVRAVNFLIENK